MSGFNLPPGMSVNDIPGNRPEDMAVETGRICAHCHVEFDGAHGQPVLCWSCYEGNPIAKAQGTSLPKAWLEEKPK